MRLFGKNLNKEILYIAEIGVNHEGNLKRCIKLINEAKKAGADVVKFQCYTPEKYVSIFEKKFVKVKKFFFNEKTFKKIINYCKKIKINYLFTPLSHDWVDFIKSNSKNVKIASGDLNFDFLLKKITNKNLNIILSTGISNLPEINHAVKLIKKEYKKNTKKKLILMHCVSSYPVEDKDANLLSIKFIKDKFNLITGYSNHVKGINACLGAICLGARVIEFHFTDNKKRRFRDHQLSLNKFDVKKLIKMGNNFNLLRGKYEKKINFKLAKEKRIISKGLVAKINLKRDQKISKSNVDFARPAKYLYSFEIEKILKRKLRKNIQAGTMLKIKDFV